MVLISVNDSTMWCKPLYSACYDFVKKSDMTCFISLFSHSGSVMISYPTLHSCSNHDVSVTPCSYKYDGFHSFSPPLSPSVPPYCRSCSLLCCLSSFPPSCSLTPAPPPCSTSRRPTTSQSPSSPRLASTGPPAWFAAHRITPTPSRWGGSRNMEANGDGGVG